MDVLKLDARNLLCPMPVIKVSNKIESMKSGDVLDVMVTDPGSKEDIPCWCRLNGHKVREVIEKDEMIRIIIEIDYV